LRELAGSKYDPQLVNNFIHLLHEEKEIDMEIVDARGMDCPKPLS
jgi:response regulator RpfG family c-di-GMP phosphodiesterase